jgi:hypothetical protein
LKCWIPEEPTQFTPRMCIGTNTWGWMYVYAGQATGLGL